MTRQRIGRLMPRLASQRGLSLVEATVILMVLSALTAMLAPAAGAYLDEARNTKAKSDVEVMGAGIDQLLRNVGLPCISDSPTNAATPTATGPCALNNRVELLISGSSLSANKPVLSTTVTAFAAPASTASAASLNWSNQGGGGSEVADAWKGFMDAHLVTNSAGYTGVSFTAGGGPLPAIGWRGAYVNGTADVDPWGYIYQANTAFLTVSPDATDGTGTGQRRGGWTSNVIVISAGSNGVVQTSFGTSGAKAVGDDIIYVVQGATR